MIKKFTLLFFAVCCVIAVNAQISISAFSSPYTQDFNTLAASGTTNAITTLPTGWTFLETGTGANTTYAADNGSTASGNTYSYGTGTNSERALGTLLSGSVTSTVGAQFTNNTGGTINTLSISYTGEQWRLGALGRLDKFDFQYSTNATSVSAGAYTDVDNLDFAAPVTTGTAGSALDGNLAANKTTITFTISGLTIAAGANFWIRWNDFNPSGSDDGLAIDDFSISATGTPGGPDVTPPVVSSLSPADNATNVSATSALQITFSEPVLKGTGNITVYNSNGTVFQTINVNNAAVSISGSSATVTINTLSASSSYYIIADANTFTDAALNNFAGILTNTDWNFTTAAPPAAGVIGQNYSFTNCATFASDGWLTYNVNGAEVWSCVAFGRTTDNGMQMNGFNGTAKANEDWLISPAYDLTTSSLPTLKFWSRLKFAGNDPVLKISTNYIPGTDPNTGTWTTLNGSFPPNNSDVWTLSDNIDLSGYNTTNVRVAWVYTSTTAAASRVTIDDVSIYTGVVLAPCDEPADQATALTLSATPTTVTGNFTAAASSVDGYLIIRSTSATLSSLPADGTNYTVGQAIGGGVVIANGTATNFTNSGLTPSTAYYYFVFAYNSENCSGGTNYLTSITPAPAGNTNTVSTPAFAPCVQPSAAPTNLVLSATNTSVSGVFTAEASANKYLVVISQNPTLSASPVDGTTYTAGTSFGGGTIVSYSSNNSFTATGLTAATQYYVFIFSVSGDCTGEPDYYTAADLEGSKLTGSGTGVPTGYYNAAAGQTCQNLKTALKTIVTNGSNVLGYTPGLWNIYQYSDQHRNDANTADIIWDMYSDNPTGPEPYTFTYGTNQCGTYTGEGQCYNREHTTPQSWFNSLNPMVSDAHHIFPTDGKVNAVRSNYPYGEVTTATSTSLNGSKLGTGNNFGYTGTVFEPINAYKGDFARAGLYMSVRYEDEIISQNWSSLGTGNVVFLSPTDQPDPVKRRLQIYDTWYLNTLIKWNNQDPVSQKEIDRNNAIYYQAVSTGSGAPVAQANRNPFIDHPEYVAQIFQCTGVLPVTLIDFTAKKIKDEVLLNWYATQETNFKKYVVERSSDGVTFNAIGEVAGTNIANYAFTDDRLPNASVVYYRLRMVDIDGKERTGKIVSVRLNNNLSNAFVYPNPTKDNLNIKLYESLKDNSNIQIADMAGRIVMKRTALKNSINLNLDIRSLSPGRYFVKIQNTSQVINESFVVIR